MHGMWRLMYGHAGNHYMNNQNRHGTIGSLRHHGEVLVSTEGIVDVFPSTLKQQKD